jgi:hypothetical protein
MKWFFNWVQRGLDRYSVEERYVENNLRIPAKLMVSKKDKLEKGDFSSAISPMNFKIYPATGGHIVEYFYYNQKTEDHDRALHLIPSNLDLGTELAKIMTFEALKR